MVSDDDVLKKVDRACKVSLSFEILEKLLGLPIGIQIVNVVNFNEFWKRESVDITLKGDGLGSDFNLNEGEMIHKAVMQMESCDVGFESNRKKIDFIKC